MDATSKAKEYTAARLRTIRHDAIKLFVKMHDYSTESVKGFGVGDVDANANPPTQHDVDASSEIDAGFRQPRLVNKGVHRVNVEKIDRSKSRSVKHKTSPRQGKRLDALQLWQFNPKAKIPNRQLTTVKT